MEPKDMELSIIRSLKARTGRGLDEWLELLAERGPASKRDRITWLKEAYGLGHFQARTIATRAQEGTGPYDDEAALLSSLFSHADEHLLETYEAVMQVLRERGDDVRVAPLATQVSFYRRRRFMAAKPLGNALILGFVLPEGHANARLVPPEAFGGPGSGFTAQMRLSSAREVDTVVASCIEAAYRMG